MFFPTKNRRTTRLLPKITVSLLRKVISSTKNTIAQRQTEATRNQNTTAQPAALQNPYLVRARLVLSDSLERERFIRLRIQLFERAIELLDFSVEDGGADSVIEVSDLTGISHTGINLVVKEYQRLIIDYYACLVGRKGRKRVIFASREKCYSTLFKFISPKYILEDYQLFKRGQDVQMPDLVKTGCEKHGEIVMKLEAREIRIWGIPADTTTT